MISMTKMKIEESQKNIRRMNKNVIMIRSHRDHSIKKEEKGERMGKEERDRQFYWTGRATTLLCVRFHQALNLPISTVNWCESTCCCSRPSSSRALWTRPDHNVLWSKSRIEFSNEEKGQIRYRVSMWAARMPLWFFFFAGRSKLKLRSTMKHHNKFSHCKGQKEETSAHRRRRVKLLIKCWW